MNPNPLETDWKAFRRMVPDLRERYLCARNEELAAILGDEQLTPTERFWEVEERAKKIAKALRECLDGHTRSKMKFFMIVMINHDMLSEDDLSNFSDDLRESLLQYIE